MYAYLSSHADFYIPLHLFAIRVCMFASLCASTLVAMWECVFMLKSVCICPHGPNQVSDTFCFGSSLMDEIFICAIDQEGAGPKLSV